MVQTEGRCRKESRNCFWRFLRRNAHCVDENEISPYSSRVNSRIYFDMLILVLFILSFTSLLYETYRGIAASAPILQFQGMAPCNIYSKIVTADFTKASKSCSETIRKSWGIFSDLGTNGKCLNKHSFSNYIFYNT
jgi:hypothetical protein